MRASVSATSRGGLVRGEDERHAAPEDTLEDRPDQRVVRAAEDHRVDARILERRGVLAHRARRLLAEGIGPLDQRHEAWARNLDDVDARVERSHELGVPAARDGRLGGQEPDAAVARRQHGSVGLRGEHADDRHRERPLQIRERRGRGRVARRDDQLDALALQVARDLSREAADLGERARAVREPGGVSQVEEVLVREGDEALVQDGQAAHARVEDADRPLVHPPDTTAAAGCSSPIR